jgi:uncharacterized membrane protein
MLGRVWNTAWEATRRYFVAGLLAFAPLGITIWAVAWIIQRLDNLLLPRVMELLFPGVDQAPEAPPLVGALFTFLVILLSGVIVRHLFGHEIVRLGEKLLSRVPVARSIYGGVKQLFEAIVQSNSRTSFNRVVLIEYPRKDLFAIAFTTGPARGPMQAAVPDTPLINCFVPTTPNPTTGFYLLIPEDEIRDIDLTVEDAFKVIMSAGLVSPESEELGNGIPAAPPAEG